jgi:hypothetical protein
MGGDKERRDKGIRDKGERERGMIGITRDVKYNGSHRRESNQRSELQKLL